MHIFIRSNDIEKLSKFRRSFEIIEIDSDFLLAFNSNYSDDYQHTDRRE